MSIKLTSEFKSSNVKPINKWVVELTDLGASQVFMGNIMTGKYFMIGITSSFMEDQISINSVPESIHQEVKIPICLEKCNSTLTGQIIFRGVKKILKNWEVFFLDNRFDRLTKVIDSKPIPLSQPLRNTRSEHLRLMGYTEHSKECNSFFELVLKPINAKRNERPVG